MFKTKKDVDRHVRTALSKLRSETEKSLRGFTIAKLYYKINEYSTSQHYISSFLSVKEDSAPAHKLLGQCYLQLKKPDKALASFQRSLQLDPKQHDLLIEVCKLLLNDNSINLNKAKYWCDLAENEKVQHDAIFSLRLKLLNKDSLETKQVEELILKEISSRPADVNLRVRLVRHFIEQNKLVDAFKYAFDLQMKNYDLFSNSGEWYNVVGLVLNKYKQIVKKKTWDFWLLLIMCYEKQVEISFSITTESMPNAGTTELANLLFNFDQCLFEASLCLSNDCKERELVTEFLRHYRGQFCLYAAALLYKREIVQNKNHWQETTKNALPLLILAFQCGAPDTQELWLKHSRDQTKQLIQLWNREGAFRCSQAGRTLLSCVEAPTDSSVSSQVQQILSESRCWSSTDDILSQVRQYCSDNAWRHKLFRILFPNSDHIIKMQSSLLINCQELAEPNYEIPSYADVESYEEIAQYLRPQSLQHMVYLCLGSENLANIRCKFFSGLNFSTQNLSFCGAESLNQLDIETFLYGTAIQAQRAIDIEKTFTDNYNSKNCGKPKILPFVNVVTSLCTEEQMTWWLYAYQVYKNLINDNLAEVRATLQYGIEAVRGINGPKIDLIIVLRLGKIFDTRSQDSMKPMEKKFLEIRVETLYKYGLNMLKLHNKGVLEPYRKLFKFSNSNSSQVEREINSLAEEAITHLAARYFKNSEYEECIEELSGIQLPFATYFQAEAYRKLDESNKTPKKTKKIYLDKARDCLNQTLNLLGNSNISTNHPLNSVVHSEIKRLQYTNKFSNDTFNHGTYAENTDDFLNETPNYNSNYNNRLRRADVLSSSPRSVELENLVKQMATTLTFLKEEFIDIIKPEVVGIKKELTTLKEKLETMEENMKKKSNPPSRDDDPSDLNDLYIMDDELQNQIYGNQHNMYPNYGQQHPIQHPQHSIRTPPNTLMNQPSQLHASVVPPHHQAQQPNTYSSPMYNPGYSMNYFPQYVMPGTHPAPPPLQTAQRSALGINQHSLPFVDHGLNFNLAGQQPAAQQIHLPQPDNRSNLFGLLTQTSNTQERIQTNQPVASSTPNMWNRLYNSGPVEKGPPVNVVITSSDPLPTNTISLAQPTLSVTIPPQHIKSSTVSNEPLLLPPLQQPLQHNTNFPIITNSIPSVSTGLTSTVSAIPIGSLSSLSKNNLQQTMKSPEVYSTRASDSIGSDTHNRSGDSEYDPRPDFKPVIPLPKEIDVKTGEEDEDVLFCSRAKLFRYIDKEWKERGLGDMKILRNTNDGKIRILMRREQTHKICANHIITEEMCLTQAKNEERSYIWAANDYADEELKVEKLCVRFKHADTAKEFYNVFKKAQHEAKKQGITSDGHKNKKESENTSQITINPMLKSSTFNFSKIITPTESNINNSASAGFATKANLGISTPAAIGAKDISVETKSSPFTGFTFKPTLAGTPEPVTPFANIFSTLNKTPPLEVTSSQNRSDTITSHSTKKDESVNKSISETEDDYVPTAQFKPVIPLPDLVEVQTGEENEIVLFEHRAKLLRYDKESSQWKERGIGNMKILADKENTDLVRLVMRRETVHKLCCNQRLNKSMKFKKSPNTDCALSWCGQDFSENELNTELLTIRFKTAEICSAFHKAILEAQANMPDNFVELNPDSKSKVSQRTQGFGNIFKPEPGSWNCRACYVQNLAIAKDCVACGSLRDNDTKKIEGTKKSEKDFSFGIKPTSDPKKNEGFGDKFKLKPGSWNCAACYVTNGADVKKCLACDTLRDKQILHKGSAKKAGNTITACVKTDEKVAESFGDKFKPKPGSWTCKACYLSNASDTLYCIACENPKDDTVPKKNSTQTNIFSNLGMDAPKTTFTFGFASNKEAKDITMPKTESSKNVFGDLSSSPSSKFTFGTIAATTGTITDLSKTSEAPITATYTFGRTTTTTTSEGAPTGFTFGLISSTDSTKIQPSSFSTTAVGAITTFDNSKISSQPTTLPTFSFPSSTTSILGMSKSAESNKTTGTAFSETSTSSNMSKQNIDIENTDENDQFKLEKRDFQFELKVKSPGKVKSPLKIGDENDLDNVEEENSTYFTPVIPLPDKIEVKTGEEDEKELYCHRAKLFRFVETENGMEWKERGLGDVKILKHRKTEKLRVVMRREKILKICLNHVLNADIEYKRKDDKSWHFIVNDYSEGEIEKIHFCLRFKSGEVAEEFMDAVQKSIAGEIIPEKEQASTDNQPKLEDKHNISEEDRELADRLQLPENFFNKSIANCSGCRGCDPDSFVFPVYNAVNKDFIDDDPIPLELEYEPISRKSESSILKHTSFSFVTPPKSSSDSSTNPFRSPNIFQNNQSENKILTDQGEQQNNKFVLPLKNLEEQDDNKEKPDEGKFVSGGFLFGNAGNSFADKAKPSFGSGLSIFGATKCQNEESLDKPPVTNISFNQHIPLNEVNNKNSSTTTGSRQEFMFDNKIGIEGITSESRDFSSSTPITDKTVQNTSDNQSSKSTFFFGGVPIFADVTPTFGITNQGNIFGGFKPSESTPESILARQPRKGLALPIFSVSNLTFPNANKDSDLSSNMDTIIKESSTDKIVPINMFSNSSPASESSNLIEKEINSSLSPTTSKDSSIISSDPLASCLSGGDFKKELEGTEEEPIFKMNDNISFAALAQATTGNGTFRTIENTAEFVGLTNTNAFSSFLNPQTGKEKTVNALNLSPGGDITKQDDNTYDPHYDPVIELPKEIEVRTGEEDETKLFGDRGTLYRYDSTSKEWKERGVGEMKILHHSENGTYRLLLRRELIYKTVLNHAITSDFKISPMGKNGKAFLWAAKNFAEAEQPAEFEKLAIKFSNINVANRFEKEIKKCIAELAKRAGLEPEED